MAAHDLCGPRRRRKAKPARPCMTAGCGNTVPAWQHICSACFKQLPFATRKAIAEAGQAQDAQRKFRKCRDAGAWLAEKRIKQVEGQ